MYIYKVCPPKIWEKAIKNGAFIGAGIDLTDGYIHFSSKNQVQPTIDLHFIGHKTLNLIAVWSHNLDIKWEPARNGQLFPHLYGPLPLNEVSVIWLLSVGRDGAYDLPVSFD